MLKACNSEANTLLSPEMELVQDFAPVLIICKFVEGPIKTKGPIVCTKNFRRSRAGNSEVNGQMWPEFKLV